MLTVCTTHLGKALKRHRTSPTEDGVILLGCEQNPEAIYKMALDSNGAFVWTKMKQKLKYPRYRAIVAPIDDNQVTCQ